MELAQTFTDLGSAAAIATAAGAVISLVFMVVLLIAWVRVGAGIKQMGTSLAAISWTLHNLAEQASVHLSNDAGTRPLPIAGAGQNDELVGPLTQLGELRSSGLITEADFEEHKRRLLSEI